MSAHRHQIIEGRFMPVNDHRHEADPRRPGRTTEADIHDHSLTEPRERVDDQVDAMLYAKWPTLTGIDEEITLT